MSTPPPRPPPIPPSPAVVTVVKPKIGGKVLYDNKEMAWTGGKPNYDWTAPVSANPMKKSPDCWRQANPIYEAKAFQKLTEPETSAAKLELDMAEPTLSAFAKRVKIHMERCGMDSVFYVEDPTRPRKMINVLETYQMCSATHVQGESKRLQAFYDEYDDKNALAARLYLRASFGPKLLAKLDARDPKDEMSPVEIFMLAADRGTSITPNEIDSIKYKMKATSPMDYPGQNIGLYCTAIRGFKLQLDNAGAYEQSITAQIMLQMHKVTVELFRIPLTLEIAKVNATIKTIHGLSQADQLTRMTTENQTLELLLWKYEEEYNHLVRQNLWDPAKNKTDKKAPGIHPGSTQAEINAFIDAKVKSKFDKLKKDKDLNETNKDNKKDENTSPKAADKDATCYACGKKGHYKDQGKCKPEDIAEYEKNRKYPPMPGPNDPQEIMWKGKKRYFCSKCGRKGMWTLKHTTATHVDNFKRTEPQTEVSNFCVPVTEEDEVSGWHRAQF